MSQSPVPQEIARGAELALSRVSGAKAVVLFGSRARDDWHPESDWDLAVITAQGDHMDVLASGTFDSAEQLGHEVNCVVLPEPGIERRCRCIGGFDRALVRDGVVIAGDWDRSHMTDGELYMDNKVFEKHLKGVDDNLAYAGRAYRQMAMAGTTPTDMDEYECDRFVTCSADAAERLAKVLLISLQIDPVHKHDIDALANQACAAGLAEVAETIRSLNGFTNRDHVAHYQFDGDVLRRCGHAAECLAKVITLYAQTVQSLPETLEKPNREHMMSLAVGTLKNLLAAVEEPKRSLTDETNPKVAALLRHQSALVQTTEAAVRSMERHIGSGRSETGFRAD